MPTDTLPDDKLEYDADHAHAWPMSRNPTVTLCTVEYRDCLVPYIELFKVPVDEHGQQAYDLMTDLDGNPDNINMSKPYVVNPHPGPWRWSLTLDKRLCWEFATEAEALRAIEMMADAMAVATGWASHGASTRLNRHAPVTRETPLGSLVPSGEPEGTI